MNGSTVAAKRRIRSLLTYLPLRLRAGRAIAQTSQTRMSGFTLTIPAGVFHPKFFLSSRILLKEIDRLDLAGRRVLDMGTGSGILALAAARKGASVLAVDINPAAVSTAERNAAANGLGGQVSVTRSDLFDGIAEETFDLIIWNPPFYPRVPGTMEEAAWNAGEQYRTIERFAGEAHRHLRTGGTCLLIFSSDMDIPALAGMFGREGLVSDAKTFHRRFLETFEIHAFSKRRMS